MTIESFYLDFEQTRQVEKCLKFQTHRDIFIRTISIMCAEVLKGMVVAHILRIMSHSNRRATLKLSTDQSFVLKAKKYFWSMLIRNLEQYQKRPIWNWLQNFIEFYRKRPDVEDMRLQHIAFIYLPVRMPYSQEPANLHFVQSVMCGMPHFTHECTCCHKVAMQMKPATSTWTCVGICAVISHIYVNSHAKCKEINAFVSASLWLKSFVQAA